MTHREKLVLLVLALAAVAAVTVVGELRRRSLSDRAVWLRIPDDARDNCELGGDGEPVLDVYGRPKPAATLDVTILGAPDVRGMAQDTWIERKLEERFRLRIEAIILDPNQYHRKRPLMLCGGTIPDLYWINDPSSLQKDVDNGFLVELSYDILERHAPRLVGEVNRLAPHGWAYALYRGGLFGLPTVNETNMRARPGIWRADWLRNVGLIERDAQGLPLPDEHGRPRPAVPRTLEQFEEALRRFRYNDPDGNGEMDTYGMSGDITEWWWTTFNETFAAYGVLPFDWQYDPDSGELSWGGVMPAALQAIRTLRRWREEGLIDPDFLGDTMRGDQLLKKFKNGKIGYVGYCAVWWRIDPRGRDSLQYEIRQLNPNAEIAISVPPIGPARETVYDIMSGRPLPPGHRYRGVRMWGGAANILGFGRPTARQPAKVVRLLRMLNTLAEEMDAAFESDNSAALMPTDPGAPIYGTEVCWGRRLLHSEFADPSRGLAGGAPRVIPPYDGTLLQKKEGLLTRYFMLFRIKPEHALRLMRGQIREYTLNYERPEWALSDVFGKPDVLPSAGRYLEALRKYQLLQYSLMIRSRDQGGVPVEELDAAFERFTEGWLKYGGSVLLEEARQLQRQMEAFYREHGIEPARDSGTTTVSAPGAAS